MTKLPTAQGWYDKKGKPLTDYVEIEKLLSNLEYKIIKNTVLKNGIRVSTIWLGLDHSFDFLSSKIERRPLIFETMAFAKKEKKKEFSESLDMQRYYTEEEAKKGHELMIKKYK